MSWQSTSWAVTLKPERLGGVPDGAHVTLCLLANRADERGRGAFYSVSTMARMRGLSVRTIRRHLEALEAAGLIRRGDQRYVQHVPENRRPVVWDLCHKPIGELENDPDSGVTEMTPHRDEPVDNPASRGDKNVTPEGVWGDTQSTSGVTAGVTQDVINTPIERLTYLGTEGDADSSTGPEVSNITRPDRRCIHDFDADMVKPRNGGDPFPACPYCRRVGDGTLIHLAPLEPVHA